MAPLLRASFHGLRCSRLVPSPSLSSQRELLKPPESSYILRRWYGESAALEETCNPTQTVNDTARAAIQGEDSSKLVDVQQSSKEIPTTNAVKLEGAAKEPSSAPSSDKLTSSILAKLRKDISNGPKDNGVPLQAESTSSMANKLPEGSSQQIADDKWQQVKMSLRNMALKKRGNPASGGAMTNLAKTEQDENQDDFADLDLPQAREVSSKVSSNVARPAMDALRNFTLNAKAKEGDMQGLSAKQKANGLLGYQQKAKEAKPVSFSFLKSLDDTTSTSEVAEDEGSNASDWTISKAKSTLQALQTKTSDSHRSVQAKKESSSEAKSASHEVKSASSRETKNVSFHDLKRSLTEEQEGASSTANEALSSINRTVYPGYTVCIRNLPSQSNLALVKEALSLHGEVISSFKKSYSDGSCNAFVEFKTAEAMDGALASRWLSLDSKAFSIVRADAPITTVVRLSTGSAENSDSHLASICEQFGGVDHIKRRGNGVYDVYYRANELSSMSTILDSLNEVTLNRRRLVALPAPLLHPAMRKEVLKRSEGQAWHASQLSQALNRIEKGLDMVSVCFEDLKSLTAMEDEFAK